MNKTLKIILEIIAVGLIAMGGVAINQAYIKSVVKDTIIQPVGSSTDNRFTVVPTNTSVSCLTSSTQAVATSSSRQYLALVNDSANTIYLGEGVAAVSGSGIRLNANGGVYEMDTTHLYTGAINCIASGSSNLTVLQSQ